MKSRLLLVVLVFCLGCHQDIVRSDQLYGKWVLTGGSALIKRQPLLTTQPAYLVFDPSGSIQSNGWSNCYSFQFGAANVLTVTNNCVDCLVVDCGLETWHYQFTAPAELTINFGPDDVGYFQR